MYLVKYTYDLQTDVTVPSIGAGMELPKLQTVFKRGSFKSKSNRKKMILERFAEVEKITVPSRVSNLNFTYERLR